MRLNDYLEMVADGGGHVIRCRCGHVIGPAAENYKLAVLCAVAPVSEAGPNVNPYGVGEGRFVVRRYSCPGCLTLLDVEIAMGDEPPRWDLQPAIPAATSGVS